MLTSNSNFINNLSHQSTKQCRSQILLLLLEVERGPTLLISRHYRKEEGSFLFKAVTLQVWMLLSKDRRGKPNKIKISLAMLRPSKYRRLWRLLWREVKISLTFINSNLNLNWDTAPMDRERKTSNQLSRVALNNQQ